MGLFPTSSESVRTGSRLLLGAAGLTLLGALLARSAYAGDYLDALDSEAADVTPAQQNTPAAADKSGKSSSGGESGYLSALDAEADDLESQQTKTQKKDSTGIRFSRIRY